MGDIALVVGLVIIVGLLLAMKAVAWFLSDR
jgi:hypothetical protein